MAERKLKTVLGSRGIQKLTKIETKIARDPLALRATSAATAAATTIVGVKTAPVVLTLDGATVRGATIAIGATPTVVIVRKQDLPGTTWNHAFETGTAGVARPAEDAVPMALVHLTALVVAVLEAPVWALVALAGAVLDLRSAVNAEVAGSVGLQDLSSNGRSAVRRQQKSRANCTS